MTLRKRHDQSQRAKLRKERSTSAEWYWRVLTGTGHTEQQRVLAALDLARVSLRIHIFEQGRRAAK